MKVLFLTEIPDPRVGSSVRQMYQHARRLRELGHDPSEVSRFYGNMQVVTWDFATGEVEAASDPRGQGDAKGRAY